MATITVRNVPPDVQRALKKTAAAHGRSMEAEVRAILESSVRRGAAVTAWLAAARDLRGDELELPERSLPRAVDIS
ncbi:FitA-like ribbon-helix-helix domain-containing protein [Nocardioides pelophilus]|uniref:FitA-like ribbon-helix-helix domain-containing protein n=1 Tax=Nocardioides pelophilus TaxID=2172019 RepID=UPI0016024A34|nr:Arc family DNA-binding protein [Nocardioides pelophilus]